MVTIFIPTYNSEKTIACTLDSILRQTYQDWELLCVDDSSQDSTITIIERYASLDSRIRIFHKHNEGSVPYSWNFIFPKIRGEYTLYMSHDDLLLPDSVEILVRDMTYSNSECAIPVVRFFEDNLIDPEDKYLKQNQKYAQRVGSVISGLEAFDLMLDYSVPGFALWKTSIIRHLGVPITSFNSDEFAQRLWVKHCQTVIFSSAIYGYRQTENSIVRGFKPYHIYSLDTNLRLCKEIEDTPNNISHERKRMLKYKYYFTLIYLSCCFLKNKDSFDDKENIKDLIEESRKHFGTLSLPRTLKEIVPYLCSINKFMFYNILPLLRY